jgi:hypothetical protein
MCRPTPITDLARSTTTTAKSTTTTTARTTSAAKKGYLIFGGKRVWCVICPCRGSFSIFTHDSEGDENCLLDVGLESVDVDRLIVVNSTTKSYRRELAQGSHVVSYASSHRTDSISAKCPLIVKADAPRATNKPVLGQSNKQPKPMLGQSRALVKTKCPTPGFVIKALPLTSYHDICMKGGMKKKKVQLNCTGQSNVEAAEWVDYLVRARGESIRRANSSRLQPLEPAGSILRLGGKIIRASVGTTDRQLDSC